MRLATFPVVLNSLQHQRATKPLLVMLNSFEHPSVDRQTAGTGAVKMLKHVQHDELIEVR